MGGSGFLSGEWVCSELRVELEFSDSGEVGEFAGEEEGGKATFVWSSECSKRVVWVNGRVRINIVVFWGMSTRVTQVTQ